MKKYKKIDVHAHVSLHQEYEYSETLNVPLGDLLKVYDDCDVEKGILLPIISPEANGLVMPNGDACYLAHENADRFYWFCNVDPRSMQNLPTSKLDKMLSHFMSLGAIGMGELTANLYADDPMVDNLFSACEELGLPVTIHIAPTKGGCYGIIDEIGLPRIGKMLSKHPKLKIFGHSQPFWAEISGGLTQDIRNTYPQGKVQDGGNLARLLREHDNLYCDMSAGSGSNAMLRDPDHAYRFIEEFGNRMMYAIDYCLPSNNFMKKLCAFLDDGRANGSISEEHYYNICRGNAIRILNLKDLD